MHKITQYFWHCPHPNLSINQVIISSVQFSCSVMSDSLWSHEPQHTRPPCPSPIPRVHPNPRASSWWCHQTISSSVIPFSSCLQSFPASGYYQMSQLFTTGGQSIGVSALASVLPVNTQDWSLLGLASWISLQSKGLSRIFSNTTIQKHQFGVLFLPLSDAYVRSFLYLLYTLIKLYYTKALINQALSPPEAKNPGTFAWFSNNLSYWGLVRDISGQDAS